MRKNSTRTLVLGRCLKCVLAAALLVPFAIAQDTQEPDAAQDTLGLADILPDAPADLNTDAFAVLGENWDAWSEQTANLVADLYEGDELTMAEQREVINQLHRKLATMQTALSDPQYSMIHKPLRELRDRLQQRVALIQVLADAIANRPESLPAGVESTLKGELAVAVTELSNFLNRITNSDGWRSFARLEQLRLIAANGADEAALEVMKKAHANLTETSDRDESQQQFVGRYPFRRLAAAVETYIRFKESDAEAFFAAELAGLVKSLQDYGEGYRRLDGYAFRTHLRTFKAIAPAEGLRLESQLRATHFNHNLNVAISEALLSRVISDHRTDNGRVADWILGAWVTGVQRSNVNVSVDVLPNDSAAQFNILINGTSNTNTQGQKHPATIYTRGHHCFNGNKPVTFDGYRFVTGKTNLAVDANNRTVGVRTKFSWIPLLGRIADNIAYSKAQEKKAQGEAIAAGKLSNRVIPEFDNEVDGRFARANNELNSRLFGTLARYGLSPSFLTTRSTNTHIALSSRTMDNLHIGGSEPSSSPLPLSGFSAQIHESLINNALDSMYLAGRSFSESELKAEFERSISNLLGKPFHFKDEPQSVPALPSTPDTPTEPVLVVPTSLSSQDGSEQDDPEQEDGEPTFVFDSIDPIRIAVVENGFNVIMRTGLKQEGKDDVPLQEVTIPLTFSRANGTLTITAGETRVTPLVRGRSRLEDLTRAAQIRRVLKRRLDNLNERAINLSFSLPIDETTQIPMSVSEFSSANGWLTIVAQ